MKYNERFIQKAIYKWVTKRGDKLFAPNIYYYKWESDMLTLDSKGRLHEFEIKISYGDFKADFKKQKHTLFTKLRGGVYTLRKNRIRGYNSPNFFWYVCPPNMIKPSEIPLYAGLAYTDSRGGLVIIKRPKVLHKKITDRCLISQKFAVSLGHRYLRK